MLKGSLKNCKISTFRDEELYPKLFYKFPTITMITVPSPFALKERLSRTISIQDKNQELAP